MLEELSIQNYALIDRLTITFGQGLNVLSGETGAGKSILVGALSLLHGARADTSNIRTGAEETLVSGIFSPADNPELWRWLSGRGIKLDNGQLIIRRTVKRQGRGTIYVQSVPVTLSDLEELTGLMFDLHGQHEHQSLISEDNHRKVLDRFGGFEEEANSLSQLFSELSGLKKKMERMLSTERERLREMDILQFAVKEIDEAALRPEEEAELDQERRILSQHEKLFGLLEEVHEATAENRGGALGGLRTARQAMESIVNIDGNLAQSAKRIDDVFFELEDIVETVREYRSGIRYSPERLEQCEDRLALIHRLEKKYGNSVEEVLRYADEAREQIASLETWEEDKSALAAEIQQKEKDVLALANTLSGRRKEAAGRLQSQIEQILRSLGMSKTRFVVAVEQKSSQTGKPVCGPYGIDVVAFRFSANTGEPVKPLSSIASGGEMSRVMLAIKTVLAETDRISSLVFDEIDAGIGGEVALAVGQHLHELAGHKQVLCITHLASIAVRADNHIKVEKGVREDRTVTRITPVRGDSRVEEIARMLAGDRTGKTSRVHALELLQKYGSNTR